MAQINPIRHIDILNPDEITDLRFDIIGCGATGSKIALSLAKLGIKNIHCWDFDIVEEHNIPNQIFFQEDIGKLKVDALQRIIFAATGSKITPHAEKVDGTQELGDIVFLLTDTMESRKQIWDNTLKYSLSTSLMIETRMGKDNGRIYTIIPTDPTHVKKWEETLYDSHVVELSSCGTTISVGPTADIVAGYAVWQFLIWYAIEKKGKEGSIENEIIFSLQPLMHISQTFTY